ncbi:MAG: hypothetical protein EHM18_16455 [Acidobacteria bacterium]|nr:MAG: hypothetical protein EHM18_16455 [Acidobacteriota bacterium]
MSQRVSQLFLTLFGAVTVISIASLSGCGGESTGDHEIQRVASPDGRVEAVLTREDTWAFDPYNYRVFVVPRGTKPEAGDHYFMASYCEDLAVHWSEDKRLQVEYRKAQIKEFSNCAYPLWKAQGDYRVELRLKPLEDRALTSSDGGTRNRDALKSRP